MFKRISAQLLKEENYIDALAFLASKFETCKTIEAAEEKLDQIDETLWGVAMRATRIDDPTGQALRLISGLQLLIDNSHLE